MTDECYLLPVSVEIIDCMPDISYTLQWPGRCPPHKLPLLLGGDLGPILYMAPWAYQSPYPRQYQDQLIHFSTVCSCDHQKPHYIGNSRLHHLLCMRACVLLCMRYTHARTHTHLTALCPGLPGWAGFTEARDSEWQWHQLGHMQVCTSLQTDNHANTPPLSFLLAGCPSCRPTNSVKALKTTTCACDAV